MNLDVYKLNLGTLYIDGTLIISDLKDTLLSANNIWIRAGLISAGEKKPH